MLNRRGFSQTEQDTLIKQLTFFYTSGEPGLLDTLRYFFYFTSLAEENIGLYYLSVKSPFFFFKSV